MLIDLLEIAITLAGDNKSKNVREAADVACKAFPAKLSEFSVRACLGPSSPASTPSSGSPRCARSSSHRQLRRAQPQGGGGVPPRDHPRARAGDGGHARRGEGEVTETMAKVGTCVGNIDIDPFIPTLIECIHKVDEVPECVHKLAATTFVQQVEAPTLSIMGPLLQRGLFFQQITAIKRKSAVIIDNMCKLVEDPMDAAPFPAKLLPLLKRAMDEVADPECRQVCTRAYKTLLIAAGESSDAVIDENADSKRADGSTVRAQMTSMMSEDLRRLRRRRHRVRHLRRGAALLRVHLQALRNAARQELRLRDVEEVLRHPYLALFFDGAEAAATKTLVEKAHAEYEASRRCSSWRTRRARTCAECDFSLACGALILLNNATLHMKKGKRYGLCGPNGCGKSTLTKAINNGQVDEFPPADELRTVYVEHDIQGDQHEMTVVGPCWTTR